MSSAQARSAGMRSGPLRPVAQAVGGADRQKLLYVAVVPLSLFGEHNCIRIREGRNAFQSAVRHDGKSRDDGLPSITIDGRFHGPSGCCRGVLLLGWTDGQPLPVASRAKLAPKFSAAVRRRRDEVASQGCQSRDAQFLGEYRLVQFDVTIQRHLGCDRTGKYSLTRTGHRGGGATAGDESRPGTPG